MKTILIAMLTTLTMACSWNQYCDCDKQSNDYNIHIDTTYEVKCSWGHAGWIVDSYTQGSKTIITYRCWQWHQWTIVH